MEELRSDLAPGKRGGLLGELGSQEGVHFRWRDGHVRMENQKQTCSM